MIEIVLLNLIIIYIISALLIEAIWHSIYVDYRKFSFFVEVYHSKHVEIFLRVLVIIILPLLAIFITFWWIRGDIQ